MKQSDPSVKKWNHGIAGDDRSVVEMNVPPQQNTVDQNDIIEQVAIVCHMRVGHQHVPVADPCTAVFFLRSAMNSGSFPKNVVVADFQACGRAAVAYVLRLGTNDDTGKKPVPHANHSMTDNHHMTVESGPVADPNMRTDDAKRPDLHIFAEFRSRVHLR